MKRWIAIVSLLYLTGCAVAPYESLNIDSTTNFNKPTEGMAGIYVYQWRTGIYGAMIDVGFRIKGHPDIRLNTGEYGYMELPPGEYQYRMLGGPLPGYAPVTFKANENYFFRAALDSLMSTAFLTRSQKEIDDVKGHISSGYYEHNEVD